MSAHPWPLPIVLDTNVLVAAAYASHSASRRIVDACRTGDCQMIVSPRVQREYDTILPRAIRSPKALHDLQQTISRGTIVHPTQVARVVPDDADDDQLLAAAHAGSALALVTNDHHLLRLENYGEIQILRPTQFVPRFLSSSDQQVPPPPGE